MTRPNLSARVHFTHHLCLVHTGQMPFRIVEGEKQLLSSYEDHQRLFGRGTPTPSLGSCQYTSGRSKARIRYTTNRAEATCSGCKTPKWHDWQPLDRIKERAAECHENDRRYYEQCIRDWVSEDEVIARAWMLCCRHAGVPAPFSLDEQMRRDRQMRALQASQAISSAMPLLPVFLRASARQSVESAIRERIEKLEPTDQALMGRVLERARAADVMLGDLERELASIADDADQIATRIRSAALVSVPAVH
jgi:hypothetical protein